MANALRYLLQFACFALFAVFVAYFSASPAYQYAPAGDAQVKISLSHAAERVAPCVRLSPEEVAKLAPNMRRTESCERERLPLTIEMVIDGDVVLAQQAPPSGLWGDGPASVYERLSLAPGTYALEVRLRDTARENGWDYTLTKDVELLAGRYLTVSFKADSGGFSIQ
jgi:hypothetical protein